MNIVLHNICPSFINPDVSEIWNRDVTLDAKTRVNVSAPSGTGKTSFVSILYGLLADYTGVLKFETQVAASLNRQQWAALRRQRLSLVFQDLRLFPQLSCLDNVLLKAHQTSKTDSAAIHTAFNRVGISHLLAAPAHICSQGEKQRVAFVRALVQPFDWILLDEPFSHVDQANVAAMLNLLQETCTQNKAGILLTSLEPETRLPFDRTYAL
jgi:ABC-type lipoprotein export system ATPase subunit